MYMGILFMRIKNIFIFIIISMILFIISACTRDEPPERTEQTEPDIFIPVVAELPREETLILAGFQWHYDFFENSRINWNIGSRLVMFETAYMYNFLDNSFIPLIADGPFEWNEDRTVITYRIKEAAYWNDGTKITAHDVAFTFYTAMNYSPSGGALYAPYIDTVEAVDEYTVAVRAVINDAGLAVNPLLMETFLIQSYILQKAWLETLIERNDGDPTKISTDPGDDVVSSGPYTKYFFDDTRTVVIRDEGYWGQHPDMWGKLPAPRFLVSIVYEDGAAAAAAMGAGELDVSQNFLPNVHLLWEEQGLPVSTYLPGPPYSMAASMPTAYFNMNNPIIKDNPIVRRAIAMAVDYDLIITNAVTGQSPSFREYPRSLMNPTPFEQSFIDHSRISHLQWEGNDIDGANALLDEAGYERGPDGIRMTPNGERLSFVASSPAGWTDWQAAIEIVAAAGAHIGIEISTLYHDAPQYVIGIGQAVHNTYDIFMMRTEGATPSMPWSRARGLMSSEFVGMSATNFSGVPIIPLWQAAELHGTRANIGGFSVTPNGSIPLWNVVIAAE
jgi:peptide/nickel transport system substrate-binding protein